MAVFRGIGWTILALAAMALGAELLRSLEAAEWSPLAAGEVWVVLDADGFGQAQTLSQRYLHPAVWDPLMVGILRLPMWSILAFFGFAALAIAGPRKSRKWRRWFGRKNST